MKIQTKPAYAKHNFALARQARLCPEFIEGLRRTKEEEMTQRFHSILGEALLIGLETTVNKDENQLVVEELKKINALEGFSVRDPNAHGTRPDAVTFSITHPATSNGTDLVTTLLDPIADTEQLVLTFQGLPNRITSSFQRLNFKQVNNQECLGMVCGRDKEVQPFPIRQKTQNPKDNIGYLNLDFFSLTKTWNPLFVKYHFRTPAKDAEFGYLKVGVLDPNYSPHAGQAVQLVISRVLETKVPEFLKTALTLPE